mgnify:CR=1 FL=1
MGEDYMNYHPDPLVRSYEDRKMAKGIGFYLSEHNSAMKESSKERRTFYAIKPSMTDSEISEVFEEALLKNKRVAVQTNEVDLDGHAYADKLGILEVMTTRKLS